MDYVTNSIPTLNLLGVFAKHWQPGQVKTRLAVSLGPNVAAEVARLLIETTLRRFGDQADGRVIGFAPADQEAAFRGLASHHWGLWPQPEGDLGTRMRTFFELALREVRACVLIAADSPDLPKAFVEEAFDALLRNDVVIGPALDGGYYLLGITGELPPIFDGIAWSTSSAFEQTLERLVRHGRRHHLLPPWHDLDDEGSLCALLERLAGSRTHEPFLGHLADRLKGLLTRSGPM